MNCPMNMKKSVCCCEDKGNDKGEIVNKLNCCKEVTTEINNSSTFQHLSFENKTDLASFIIPLINVIQSDIAIHYISPLNSSHSPPRDIQLLNSTFRI